MKGMIKMAFPERKEFTMLKCTSIVTACAMLLSMHSPKWMQQFPKDYTGQHSKTVVTAGVRPGNCQSRSQQTPTASSATPAAPMQTPATSTPKPAAPAQTPAASAKPAATPTPAVSAADAYAQTVVQMVNEERAKQGLSTVTLDEKACQAACVRADEIAQSFSHTRPSGESCFTVLKELGISYMGAGENIAKGQTTPERVMAAWMDSPGHYANIMREGFTRIGVCHKVIGGVHMWVQIFLR